MWEKTIPEVNHKVTVGTILLHKPKKGQGEFVVDLFRVMEIADCGDHWRGKDNLMLTAYPIHSKDLGFLEGVDSNRFLITVHTYDIADPYGEWQIVGDTEPKPTEHKPITVAQSLSMRLGLQGYSENAVKEILRWY